MTKLLVLMLFDSMLTPFSGLPAAFKQPYNNHTQAATVITVDHPIIYRYKVFSAHIFRHVKCEQKTEEKGE